MNRCEPPPELRGVDGWHWLKHPDRAGPALAYWNGSALWHMLGRPAYLPEVYAQDGWRYLSPVLTPAEADALRQERDAAEAGRLRTIDAMMRFAEQVTALRAEVARLRGLLQEALHNAEARAAQISAPEDDEIALLCERVGYGAVMDAAMRLWMRKDPSGAFIIGGCAGSYRAALEAKP